MSDTAQSPQTAQYRIVRRDFGGRTRGIIAELEIPNGVQITKDLTAEQVTALKAAGVKVEPIQPPMESSNALQSSGSP